MTAHRDLAASLSARVLDRIEADRCLNSENVAEAILDGLVLRAAKGESHPSDLDLAMKNLASLMRSRPDLLFGAPSDLYVALDAFRCAYEASVKR